MRKLVKKLIQAIPFGLKYELFYQMGRSLGVTAYQANGSSGPIFGHMYDQTLIKSYLRDHAWSSDIANLVGEVFARSASAGTFYDIGANVGTVIIPVAANQRVHCFGFEPDPGNFALLSANVAARNAPNIELKRAAVANAKGQMRFKKSAYNSGDHRLSDDGDVVVDVIALDDLPMPSSPFAAKIDTQGAEPAIFQGGERTLATADLIISEFWPWGMRRMGLGPEPILQFARAHFSKGYVLQHGAKVGPLDSMDHVVATLGEIAARGGEFDQADLILVK